MTPRILWADDEIDLLRPHILFLENKGYEVTSVANGADAVEQVKDARYDVILLDEQMPGMDGLETLSEIKRVAPEVPVVMVTKSEEEDLMEEALGGQISDYLTKPVNPSQILLTCKRLLERARLRTQKVSQDYLQRFNQITMKLMNPLRHEEWVELYQELIRYDLELEGDENARQILEDQSREANRAFGRFVENHYEDWIDETDTAPDEYRPVLSHEVVPQHVLPALDGDRPVLFFVIDCMRYDQWLEFEKLLYPHFTMDKAFYYSILPTATPYARNSIFSGLLPRDIARRYPDLWAEGEDDEHSRNRNEDAFLRDLLDRKHRKDVRMRYEKLIGKEDGRAFAVECTAERAHTTVVESGVHVHTNHVLVDAHKALEGIAPQASSLARQERLTALLEARTDHDVDSLRARYSIISFLRGDLVLDGVELWAPRVTVERLPGEESTNASRIFAGPSDLRVDTAVTEPAEPAL